MASKSPSSSILPVVAPCPAATADVPPITAGVPAPPTDQGRGLGGQSAHVSWGPLSSAQSPIDKGKRLADKSLQRKHKQAASGENNESKAQGEGLMVDARRVGHVGEFFNINPNATPRGELLTLRSTLIISLLASAFPFSG